MDSVRPWRVRTFGGFSVERDGVRLYRFRTQHAAVLLAYLAMRPDVRHSREVLADLFWPGSDPLSARQSLSQVLTNLRRELEADNFLVFVGARDSVGIHPGALTCDAAEFDQLLRLSKGARRERRRELLQEAVEIAGKGEFLPGFYIGWALEQAVHYEEALDAVRAELETEAAESRLPAEDPSGLVGRAAEIESLDRLLLERRRCISILGAGGVGKTRLALDLFERHSRRFPGATVFVRLAEVRDASDFLPAVARALNLPFDEDEPPLVAITRALAVPGLVVLDNLEHLLPQIHPLIDSVMRSCDHCTFVCTSRRRLGVAGEHILRVRPLPLAPLGAQKEDLAEAPAIRLFITRYRESGGSDLPVESLAAVGEICRSLGGLPLAIQLAASAAVAVGVEAMSGDAALHRLLPTRSPDATNSHPSLSELIDWSLTLLDEPARKELDALCLLPGSFDLGLAREIHGQDAALMLTTLHGDSLLEADGNGLMRVLEPIREHVLGKMPDAWRGELEIRLIGRCAEIAKELAIRLEGRQQREAAEDATSYWPTMRLAAQLARERQMPNEGLEILTGLHRFFHINYAAGEAIALMQPLMTMPAVDLRVSARVYASLVRDTHYATRSEARRDRCVTGIALSKQVGDIRSEARCTTGLALSAFLEEDRTETLNAAYRALELGRQVGDIDSQVFGHLSLGLAYAIYQRDAAPEETSRAQAETKTHMAAAVAVAREAGDDLMEAMAQYLRSGYGNSDFDLYQACLGEAIEIYRRNGWKLREARARAPLVRSLYAAGQTSNVLEELRALQTVYAECGRWDLRAEQVAIEAEILFRMNQYDEALVAIEGAMSVLRLKGHLLGVETHVRALIYGALRSPEVVPSLLALVERENDDEFSGMIGALARALLEAQRGEDDRAYRRLQGFHPESKPTRAQHAYADTLVAFADIVAPRNRAMAVAAYRKSRVVYREIKSMIDLQRVRTRVSALAKPLGGPPIAQPFNPTGGKTTHIAALGGG